VGGFVAVDGLPLNNVEVAFYYVRYGSVLAALSRPGLNYCPEALSVLAEVRRVYGDNDLLMGIVEENEAICRLIQETPAP
jgi:hypothetical protein